MQYFFLNIFDLNLLKTTIMEAAYIYVHIYLSVATYLCVSMREGMCEESQSSDGESLRYIM